MGIDTRLRTGFAVVLVITTLLALASVAELVHLDSLSEKLYRHPFTVSNAALDLRGDINAIRLSMLELGLTDDEAAPDQVFVVVDGLEKTIDGSLAVISTNYLGDMASVERLRADLATWRDLRIDIFGMKNLGDDAGAQRLITGPAAALFSRIEANTNVIVDFARNKAVEFRAIAEDSARVFIVTAVVCAVASIVLGVMIALSTISAIRRPIHDLAALMTRLVGGDPVEPRVPYRDRDDAIGEIALAVEVFRRHIEQRRTIELALIEAKHAADAANHAKSEFLANMSHELRTPLNAIIGFSDLMTIEPVRRGLDPRCAGYVRDINSSGRRLLDIVDDILDIARLDTAGSVPLEETRNEIRPMVEECVTLVRQHAMDAGHSLTVDLPGDLPLLRGDRRRIKQIVTNLLSNAIKFTPAGGAVSISVSCPDGMVRLMISDDGPGMAPEDVAQALTPFGLTATAYARTARGPGLGLPLAHRLATSHHARMTIDTSPGAGMIVTVQFPPYRTITGPSGAGSADEGDAAPELDKGAA